MVCIIDFDGTFFKNDFFKEVFFIKLIENPFYFFHHFFIKRKSLLALKIDLLESFTIPYNLDFLINPIVLNWIQIHQKEYQKMILVSATPDFFIKKVLDKSLIFDEIYGSVDCNLKGTNKLAFIQEKWGNQFAYMGDSNADKPIFAAAQQAFKITPKGLVKL